MTSTGTRARDAGRELPSPGRQAWNFSRHFLEMCVAMCAGGSALNALVFVVGPAWLGYPDLRETAPGPALLIIAVFYTLPMVAVMRWRDMAWRPVLEMAGATIGLAVVVILLAAVGALSADQLSGWSLSFCLPACVVMLPVMLLRLGMYTGHTAAR